MDEEIKNSENKAPRNSWKITAFVLIGLVILLSVFMFTGVLTGNVISENSAAETLVDYLNSVTDGGISLLSSEDIGNLYMVTVSYNGQNIPVYITKDGKYFVQGITQIMEEPEEEEIPTEVPKSDKPVVEAFIFSYCPYGLQFEKALVPVYNLLKDKVDFNIVAIGAMHGEFEKKETLRQISIEQLYGKDKLFEYLNEFNTNTNIGSCNGDDECLDKYLPAIYTKLQIDKVKIENYMKTSAEAIYNEQMARAESLGISGSPTFVINDVKVQVSRNPDAIKEAVCSAFNISPDECLQELSTSSASAGFGASSGSSGSSATC
jgi:protein-disulfide isomerase